MNDQNKELKLFTELDCHPIKSGGTILIPKNEVLQCSEKLLKKGLRILGYEGFTLNPDNKLQPSLQDIADYSSNQPSLELIELFLSKVTQTITHLEIIVDLSLYRG